MRRTRWLLTVLLALGGWTFYSPQAHASCVVETTGTYAEGTNLRDDKCDRGGNKKVTSGTTPSGTGAATAAAPTLAEASIGYFSWDLSGNLRMTLGTLLAGEDITNNLLMVSGGPVRGTVGNLINGAVGDATGSVLAAYTGKKTIRVTITGAGAVVQTIKIYGGQASGMVAATSALLCTINLSGTSGAAGTEDGCIVETHWAYLLPVTSLSSGTPTTVATVQY